MNNRERKVSDIIDLCYSLADDAESDAAAERWRDLAQYALNNGRIEHMDIERKERPQ